MKPIIVEDKDGNGIFLVEFSWCLGLDSNDDTRHIAIPYDAVIYEYNDVLGAGVERLNDSCCLRYNPMRPGDFDQWVFDTIGQVKSMITHEALKTEPEVVAVAYEDELPW